MIIIYSELSYLIVNHIFTTRNIHFTGIQFFWRKQVYSEYYLFVHVRGWHISSAKVKIESKLYFTNFKGHKFVLHSQFLSCKNSPVPYVNEFT